MKYMKKIIEIRDYKHHRLSLHKCAKHGYWVSIVTPDRLGRACTDYHKDVLSAFRHAETVIDNIFIK